MYEISAVYKIVNMVTKDSYIGSSRNVVKRWREHKCPSKWKEYPDSPLYLDMQKYGVDKFRFQILAPVMPEYLKDVEQEFIDLLHPTYNNIRANGLDVERYKEYQKEYWQSEKGKENMKRYRQSEKGKELKKRYQHQLCSYNGETLTLNALTQRLHKAGVEHSTLEAKKYLIK